MIGIYCHHTSRFSRNTGIQRCLRAIARALAAHGEALVPLVWAERADGLALAGRSARQHLAAWNGPPLEAWRDQAPPPGSWLLVVELISGPYQPAQAWLRRLADRQGWRLAGVFHDAIPLTWGGEPAAYHRAYMRGLVDYDLVLSTSATSRAALESFWEQTLDQRPRARLHTLPLAAEIPGTTRLRSQFSPPQGPLQLLCVGSLEPRKNHRRLLQALAWLKAHDSLQSELQLVGWPNDERVVQMVRRAQLQGLPVAWDDAADDAALVHHYQSSHLTIYPSLDEGFGMPVMESLWFGKPCLVSHAPALQELVQGGGCVAVNTTGFMDLARSIVRFQQDVSQMQALRHELSCRGLTTWLDYAQDLLKLIGESTR